MKKQLFMMGLAMMGLCTFTACSSSSDDDKKPETQEVTIQDSEYDAIINQYVDNVVMPTYRDLKTKNSALYNAVVAFGNNPSNAGFQTPLRSCSRFRTGSEHGLMAARPGSYCEHPEVTAVEHYGMGR